MIELSGHKETDHYIFHYLRGSPAERDIQKIALAPKAQGKRNRRRGEAPAG